MRRVAYLEDPAQLDPDKRSRGIDGLRPGGRHHICADRASRVTRRRIGRLPWISLLDPASRRAVHHAHQDYDDVPPPRSGRPRVTPGTRETRRPPGDAHLQVRTPPGHHPARPGATRRALQPRPVRRRQPREVPATTLARPLRR